MNIIQVQSEQELGEMVALHREIFSDSLSGHIGHTFVHEYFRRVMKSPHGFVLTCKDDGRVVGFTAGLASQKGFFDLKFMLHGMGATFYQLFSRPSIVLNILLQLRRIGDKTNCEAELLTIVAHKKFGAAIAMIKSAEECFRKLGVSQYKLYTDDKFQAAIKFHEHHGCILKRRVKLFYIAERLYTKQIPPTPRK